MLVCVDVGCAVLCCGAVGVCDCTDNSKKQADPVGWCWLVCCVVLCFAVGGSACAGERKAASNRHSKWLLLVGVVSVWGCAVSRFGVCFHRFGVPAASSRLEACGK